MAETDTAPQSLGDAITGWLKAIGDAFDPAIFIGQLVGFALIVFIVWKYVRPPVKKLMKDRQDTIRRQLEESAEADQRLTEGKSARAKAVSDADAEATQMKADGERDAEAIAVDMREQADHEVARIAGQGDAQMSLVRSNLVRGLRTDLGMAAVDRAGELVRSHLAQPGAQAASVDTAIGELEAMSDGAQDAVPTSVELIGLHSMRAGSREAARAISAAFDEAAADLDATALSAASEELTGVVEFLNTQPVLRKRLSEAGENTTAKEALVRQLFGTKVSAPVLATLVAAGNGRWSSTGDYVTALRRQVALIELSASERDGSIGQVEDELFLVSRVLENNPQLSSLLSDHKQDADKRVGLLQKLVGDQVGGHTSTLLSHAVRLLAGQPADVAVDQLAEMAAARRGESVAHVVSAVELTEAQRTRLASVLGRIYGRTISVQTEIDPALLGGLRISVGDEVIEADIATRLANAAASLPR